MRNKAQQSTTAGHSHWLVRLVRCIFGHNLKQALCIIGLMILSFQIAKGGHGFDLLCCLILSELFKLFSPNDK